MMNIKGNMKATVPFTSNPAQFRTVISSFPWYKVHDIKYGSNAPLLSIHYIIFQNNVRGKKRKREKKRKKRDISRDVIIK